MRVCSSNCTIQDGHSYERQAMETWLRKNRRSPKTNQPMDHKFLVPNHNLRKLIRDHMDRIVKADEASKSD